MSDEVVYRSRVQVVRQRGVLREAHLPAEPGSIHFGVHSEIAEHYGVDMSGTDPHATTIDYVVAAAGG